MQEADSSIFQSNLPMESKLERARMELLDLSARNRLLHVPRFSKSAKTIDVVDEKTNEVFRMLVRENKAFTFVAGRADRTKGADAAKVAEDDDDLSDYELPQPEEDQGFDARGSAVRHLDTKLQTRMTPTGLQKRLMDLYHDSRTLEEEQGVNILFLALGTLQWVDPNKGENVRHAPLILVPVTLERGSAGEKFKLKVRQEEQSSNLSLEAYLDRVHSLKLPSFESGEEFDPLTYLAAVSDAVSTKHDWVVVPDNIILGFFSFAKFLMYRDLDPNNWPAQGKLTDQPMIRSLLADGFATAEPSVSEDMPIDVYISPARMTHIVDSDSSQTLAVNDVREGRSLVIQGPPGTGKSQTIANVIAAAIADGKTVLFIAEKMAALEVVKRRLDQASVGDACLELHSNKANKRTLLEELRRTWELGSPRGEFPSTLTAKLVEARDTLNNHVERMHRAHSPSGLKPYEVIGHLIRLRQNGQRPTDLTLEGAITWTPDDFAARLQLLRELCQRVDEIGLPAQHPWSGVGLAMILPTTTERLVPALEKLRSLVDTTKVAFHALSEQIELEPPAATFEDIERVRTLADILQSAPALPSEALSATVWDTHLVPIRELLNHGSEFARMRVVLQDLLAPTALDTSIAGLETGLAALPSLLDYSGFAAARQLQVFLPLLRSEAQRLAGELGSVGAIETYAAIHRLATTGERVANAPEASPEAFAATVWDHGVDQAGDLVRAVAVLEEARVLTGGQLLDIAWKTDVLTERQALATNTGVFKFLSPSWRRARALVRTVVRDQNMPVPAVINLLDILMSGQAAVLKIQAGDDFGRAAFGPGWRGESSTSAPLQALVDWMRTLRGLDAEPRLIAGRLAERSLVRDRTAKVKTLLDQSHPLLKGLWAASGSEASRLFDDATSAELASLAVVETSVKAMVWADEMTARVCKKVPEKLSERLDLVRLLISMQS